ncbi:hypothetical protein [Paenibacillus glacialis]|nr:hypothetical protein [Paenibacillus glacialis]
MKLMDALAQQLEAWGNEKRREINIKNGDGENQVWCWEGATSWSC